MKQELIKGNVPKKPVLKTMDIRAGVRTKLLELKFQQEAIKWNNNCVGKKRRNGSDLMKEMSKIEVNGDGIIIQMYRQLPIADSSVIFEEYTGKIASWNYDPERIDARAHPTHNEAWVLNPIPTISKGVIVGISKDVQLHYARKKKEMVELGMNVDDFIIPEVGDVIYTNHFMTKNQRYYIDKQDKTRDIVVTPTDFTLENFDFLFKISYIDIESIVKKEFVGNLVDDKSVHEELFMKINPDNFSDYYVVDNIVNQESVLDRIYEGR